MSGGSKGETKTVTGQMEHKSESDFDSPFGNSSIADPAVKNGYRLALTNEANAMLERRDDE